MGLKAGGKKDFRCPMKIKTILTHPYPAFLFRLYIAGLFIYASMYKINYASEFAESIASYQIVPFWGVNFMAITLPWIELLTGILLTAGIRVRAAAVIISGLLFIFTLGVAVNLIRDAPISCGCFSTLEDAITWKTLIRDMIWLMMSLHVFFYDRILHLEKRYSFTIQEI